MKLKLALSLLAIVSCGQAAACYTVYNRANQVVYQAQTAPVDMSYPLHQTLPAVFPGGHLVFDTSLDCPREQAMPVPLRQATSSSAPLLTDRGTAQAMGLPHTLIAANVALVPAQAAARADLSTFSVIPSAVAAAPAGVPDTRAMGAGPSSRTVITEMHNPPLTAVQRGTSLSISR